MSSTTEPRPTSLTERVRAWGEGWRPTALLIGGAGIVGLLALAFSLRIHGFILDETVIKQSAVHYTQGLPHNLLHDLNARATSRLYSLLIAPLFALFHGDVGVRAARGLNGPLFASAAIPAYLLARQVLASRLLAVVAGLAAVALPWLVLTTAMFTENLAYPLVLWSVCAMAWSFRAPSLWRDLLVVALVGATAVTRTQLAALAFGYLALIAWWLWLNRPRDGASRGQWARACVRRFPVTSAVAVVGVLVVVALLVRGTLDARLRSVLGAYSVTTSDRKTLPVDVGQGVMIEVLALALGVGVVPALLAVAWWPRAAAGRLGPNARAVAAAMGCATIALFAFTMYSQGGWQGPITEERYYFYVAPFLWIAGLAAAESRCVQRRDLLEVGLGLAIVAVVLPLPRVLDLESSYFAPAMTSTNFLVGKLRTGFDDVVGRTGLSEADALGALLAVGALAAWYLWRRTPRAAAFSLVAAGVVQVALLLTTFLAIDGKVGGVPGRTEGPSFSQLGFVDRSTSDGPVTWVDNQPRTDEGAASALQRTAMVYNDGIRQRLAVPDLAITPDNFPLNSQPLATAKVGSDGRLQVTQGVPPFPLRDVVESTASQFLQLEGRTIARSADAMALEVKRLAQPVRAAWYATGLSPAGNLSATAPARLRAWGNHTVRLRLQANDSDTTVTLRFAGRTQSVRLSSGDASRLDLTVCGSGSGTLEASAPVSVAGVDLAPATCG